MKNTIFAQTLVHKQIAAILIATTLMWAVGLPLIINRAHAAQLASISDTLSTSNKGVASNHTIRFTTSPTGQLTSGKNLTITFDPGFVLPNSLGAADIDMSINGSDQNIGGTWSVSVATTTRVITFTSVGGTIGTSTPVVIKIGTNATSVLGSGPGTNQIVNPNPVTGAGVGTSYAITLGGSMDDSGITRVAVIDNVVMTASVDTTLTFNIYGTASSTSINGVTTFASSTATSMAFGTLAPNVPKVLGQRLTVNTNAKNGFSVTVVQDQNLLSASGADIDRFVDGDGTSTPKVWQSPAANIGNENTWGHYGLTTNDASLSTGDPFGATTSSALFAGNFGSSTPREIFYHNGPSDGSTNGEGTAMVAIKIEVSALQEAANDYTNSLTYVCTPVF